MSAAGDRSVHKFQFRAAADSPTAPGPPASQVVLDQISVAVVTTVVCRPRLTVRVPGA
jgi:hypothetical protein